jgi:hypothetical protein
MQSLTLGSDPLYERITIVKRAVNCPIFVKSVPISSASIFGARWLSNLSTTLFGISQILYALVASLLWTGKASGKLTLQKFNLILVYVILWYAYSNIPSRNGVGQTETSSSRLPSVLEGICSLSTESGTAKAT